MADERWRQASEIYYEALLRPAPERLGFVREACGNDDALRRDVESLLALDGSAQNFMNTSADAAAVGVLRDIHGSMVGRQLGPYRVISLLGAGGMGEVYRARDTKLGRDVAVKVLPPNFGSDDNRVARFNREAQVLAALNHPNIATIYHLEEVDGAVALVMELVEGETLAERIARGAIVVDEALVVARQVCEALEAAHEHAIIHRDLKPANIKVRPDGTVKVLDFGLAKLNAANVSHHPEDANDRSALTKTDQGVVLGTAAYMAPEQARGAPIDTRTDIWAFGCVLFEMLTGRPAFAGSDPTEVMASIIRSEPDWALLPVSASPNLQSLLRRCLQKDLRQRVHDIADVRLAIQDVLALPGTHAAPSVSRSHSGRIARIAATVLLLSTMTLLWLQFRPATPPPVQLLSILPPGGDSFYSGAGDWNSGTLAVSPDGRYLAFAAISSGTRMVWIRALDSATASPLAGTEGALLPFWSPDSRDLGFFAQGKLKRVAISGGPAQILADVKQGYGGTWSREGVILFAPGQFDLLYRVSASGGTVSRVTAFDRSNGESAHRFPTFLPDGRHFLYGTVADTTGLTWIKLGSIDSPETTPLVQPDPQAANAAYLATATGDFVLFARQQTVFAQRFDPNNRVLSGEPIQVSEGAVLEAERAAFAVFSTSGSGLIAYLPGAGPDQRELLWVDRSGKPIRRIGSPAAYEHVELSPDSTRLALDTTDAQSNKRDIWLIDGAAGTPTRFTFDQSQYNTPRWSPDGSRLVFARVRDRKGIYLRRSDGAGPEEQLLPATHDGIIIADDWSRDGKSIVFYDQPPTLAGGLWMLPLSGNRRPVAVPNGERGFNARFSPDGRWLAYQLPSESGRYEIYVQPLPASGAKWQVSRDGGVRPRWRKDGKELYFVAADGTLMATPIAASPPFQAGVPRPLFHIGYAGLNAEYPYDVSADGQQFIVISTIETRQTALVTILLNWRPPLSRS